jgi:MYXO-CTERM domain-containing protein
MIFAASLALPLLATGAAKADVVISFDGLAQNDAVAHDIGPVYSADGFVLTATYFLPASNPPSFNYFGTQSPLYPGTTALFHHNSLGQITLTRAGGGAFDFYSIGLAELPAGDAQGIPVKSAPFGVTFFGTKEDGATVSDTVTVDSFLTLKTYGVSGFQDVVEVHWFQGAGPPASPTHQFSDIDVSPVPEPHGAALLAVGLAAIGAWRRVRHR